MESPCLRSGSSSLAWYKCTSLAASSAARRCRAAQWPQSSNGDAKAGAAECRIQLLGIFFAERNWTCEPCSPFANGSYNLFVSFFSPYVVWGCFCLMFRTPTGFTLAKVLASKEHAGPSLSSCTVSFHKRYVSEQMCFENIWKRIRFFWNRWCKRLIVRPLGSFKYNFGMMHHDAPKKSTPAAKATLRSQLAAAAKRKTAAARSPAAAPAPGSVESKILRLLW